MNRRFVCVQSLFTHFSSNKQDENDSTVMLCDHGQDDFKCRMKKTAKSNDYRRGMFSCMYDYCCQHLPANGWKYRLICSNPSCSSTLLFHGRPAHDTLYKLEGCERKMKHEQRAAKLKESNLSDDQSGTPKLKKRISYKRTKYSIDGDDDDQKHERTTTADSIVTRFKRSRKIMKQEVDRWREGQEKRATDNLNHDLKEEGCALKSISTSVKQELDEIWMQRTSNESEKGRRNQRKWMSEQVRQGFAAIRFPNGEIFIFKTRQEMFEFVQEELIKEIDQVSV